MLQIPQSPKDTRSFWVSHGLKASLKREDIFVLFCSPPLPSLLITSRSWKIGPFFSLLAKPCLPHLTFFFLWPCQSSSHPIWAPICGPSYHKQTKHKALFTSKAWEEIFKNFPIQLVWLKHVCSSIFWNLYVEILIDKVIGSGILVLGKVIWSWEWNLISGVSALMKEVPESSLVLSTVRTHSYRTPPMNQMLALPVH